MFYEKEMYVSEVTWELFEHNQKQLKSILDRDAYEGHRIEIQEMNEWIRGAKILTPI